MLDITKPVQTRDGQAVHYVGKLADGRIVIERNLPYSQLTFIYLANGWRTGQTENRADDIINVPTETSIWVWKVRIDARLSGEGTQVGWSWSEKEARDYAGNSLLSLQKVTLKEGEDVNASSL